MNNIIKQKNSGFTLIELMVSITLFSIALVMALGAVLTIIDLNRKTQAMVAVTNNINFAVDSIVRIIKSSEDISDTSYSNGTCTGADNINSQITLEYIDVYEIFPDTPGTGLKDISYRLDCTSGTIERQIDTNGWDTITTTSDMVIEDADFDVIIDTQQKVEMIVTGLATVGSETSDFVIQTTATRRK